jgi:hypothetical protein
MSLTLKALAFLLLLAVLMSCASTHHAKNKKLDPRKPIPCPTKNC